MAEPTTGEKLLTRLRGPGITGNQFIDTAPGLQSLYDYATTPSAVKDIANQLGKYVDQGFMTPDEAFVELRTQVEGRRGGTGVSFSNIPQTATSGANGGAPDDSKARIELLTGLGYSPLQAAYLVANNLDQGILGLDLLKSAGNLGGGGGSGRIQFPSEAALQEAQARQANAEADILTGGSRLRPGPGGLYYDALTGQTVDPSSAGLGDRQIAQNRYNTDVNAGVETRGQDITQQLGLLGAQNTATRNATDAAVGLGNLGVARTDQIRQILSNPSDALARLYMQRGGVSPVDRITQADLLNAFNKNIRGINDSYNSMLKGGSGGGGVVPSRLQLPLPAAVAPKGPDLGPLSFNSTDPNNPGGFYNPARDNNIYTGWANTPEEQAQAMSNDNPNTPGSGIAEAMAAAQEAAGGAPLDISHAGEAQQAQFDENGNVVGWGFAKGGYTNDKVFLGNEKGSELFINPTGAPLAIVPHNITSKLTTDEGKIKGHSEGTMSEKPRTRLEANPTGGFFNSFMEVMHQLGRKAMEADNKSRLKSKPEIPNHASGTMFGMPTNGVQQVGGYNPSDLGDYGDVTQQGLIDYARQAAGPGGNAVLNGTRLAPFAIPGLQTPTAMSFNQLSNGEKQGLSTRLAVEFNSTLDDLVHQIEERYSTGPNRKARYRG